jgi:general secretion pathway protein A
MDRAEAVRWPDRAGSALDSVDDFVLPSRRDALAGIVSALEARGGPVLLTGEPGAGKTWLCRRLRSTTPPPFRWAAVDLGPAIAPGEFYDLILHAMGADEVSGPAGARMALTDLLSDEAADGERWGLIVEEGQNASVGVLEELRVLGNRVGEPGAFAGLVLSGQNPLARRLSMRPLAALDARIVARFHLRRLEVEELRAWLGRLEPGRDWDADSIEQLHRETGGHPRRVLSRVGRWSVVSPALSASALRPLAARRAVTVAGAEPSTSTVSAGTTPWEPPSVAPVKPPLRVGDGMIEVGWDAATEQEAATEPEAGAGTSLRPTSPVPAADAAAAPDVDRPRAGESEERIEDHYAALQAWTEWARNQGRDPVGSSAAPVPSEAGPGTPGYADAQPDLELDPARPSASQGHPSVWAEAQHEFAPYSQLFTRLRQSREGH